MPFKNYRVESRDTWGAYQEAALSREQLQLGAQLRIADAVEKMAQGYQSLIDERERYKRWYEEERVRNQKLRRQVSALRGHNTRLKKKS